MRTRLSTPFFLASTLVLGVFLGNSITTTTLDELYEPRNPTTAFSIPTRVAPQSNPGQATDTAGPRDGFTGTLSQTHYVYLPAINKAWENLPEPVTPDDPYYPTWQWNLPQIRAPYAWAVSTGNSDVIIAVVDSGVDMDHPDLASKLVPGYDFVNDDSNPNDDYGHGTHVAGIAASATDNAAGIAGLSWEARIMPLKVLNGSGSGTVEDAVDAVVHAVDQGAQVINLSLGSTSTGAGEILQSAVDYAHAQGAIVVAAAGNCGDSNYGINGCSYMNQPVYPAAGEHIVAVASTTSTDIRSGFSNVGSYVDVAAPGSYIYSTYPGTYRTKSGTSQATPHVAGLAALIWAVNPSLSNDQVEQIVEETAVDLGEVGQDNAFGHGRIDAYQAVARATYGPFSTATRMPVDNPISHASLVLDDERVPKTGSFEPGVILVKFRRGTSIQTALAASSFASELRTYAARATGRIPALEILRLSVPKGQEMKISTRLRRNPTVEYAEPNYTIHAIPANQTAP